MCIFCKIVAGEIPAYTLYEDDQVMAFLDITQGTKGHTLLIPKHHVTNLFDMDEKTASTLFSKVPMLARALKEAFQPIGLNLVNNNDQPLQSVFHAHLHLIPRYPNDGMKLSTLNHMHDLKEDDYKALQEAIKTHVKG